MFIWKIYFKLVNLVNEGFQVKKIKVVSRALDFAQSWSQLVIISVIYPVTYFKKIILKILTYFKVNSQNDLNLFIL